MLRHRFKCGCKSAAVVDLFETLRTIFYPAYVVKGEPGGVKNPVRGGWRESVSSFLRDFPHDSPFEQFQRFILDVMRFCRYQPVQRPDKTVKIFAGKSCNEIEMDGYGGLFLEPADIRKQTFKV